MKTFPSRDSMHREDFKSQQIYFCIQYVQASKTIFLNKFLYITKNFLLKSSYFFCLTPHLIILSPKSVILNQCISQFSNKKTEVQISHSL